MKSIHHELYLRKEEVEDADLPKLDQAIEKLLREFTIKANAIGCDLFVSQTYVLETQKRQNQRPE